MITSIASRFYIDTWFIANPLLVYLCFHGIALVYSKQIIFTNWHIHINNLTIDGSNDVWIQALCGLNPNRPHRIRNRPCFLFSSSKLVITAHLTLTLDFKSSIWLFSSSISVIFFCNSFSNWLQEEQGVLAWWLMIVSAIVVAADALANFFCFFFLDLSAIRLCLDSMIKL